jgi:hypothetical protein
VPITARFSLFTWLLIALVVVIFALAAINSVLWAVRVVAFGQPINAATGSLLYATTFDSSTQDWSLAEGQMSAKVADNSLQISINQVQQGVSSILNNSFGDFDVRVNIVRTAAPDPYSEAGIIFRCSGSCGDSSTGVIQNYYMFKIRGDGAYRIERLKDGTLDVLSEWHVSPAVLQGLNMVNQLRVVGKGNTFTFFANDQPLVLCPNGPDKQKSTWNSDQCLSNNAQTSMELKDGSFSNGKLGVGAAAESSVGVDVSFKDFVVYAP